VRDLAVRMSRGKLRGGMPTSAHRLKAGLVRKAPVMNQPSQVFSLMVSIIHDVLPNWSC